MIRASVQARSGFFDAIGNAFQRHSALLIVFALLQLGDIISTHLALKSGLSEGNPIPAAVLASSGELGMYALKVVGVLAFLVIICLLDGRFKRAWHAVFAFNVIMFAVVLSNSLQVIL